MINDVLDLAKIESGNVEWKMQPLGMAEVVERAASATSALFAQKGLPLVVEAPGDLPLVLGDQDRLIQVLINLLSNAVKFTDQGRVTCRVAQRDGELLVSVIDTGMGIAPADHATVFEQFKQVGDTLTDKPHGTGLGLPICKQIVERHGGRLWLESELGQGSAFHFTLPLLGQPAEEPTIVETAALADHLREQVANGASHRAAGQKAILIADDDAGIRALLRQELDAGGYHVREAADGRAALAAAKHTPPDLIILDVLMPELNGFDVAAVLKHDPATAAIPIIMLTVVENPERGYQLGVDRYFTKPFDSERLVREVGVLVAHGLNGDPQTPVAGAESPPRPGVGEGADYEKRHRHE
jgi:CheY-like chemotaxis protein